MDLKLGNLLRIKKPKSDTVAPNKMVISKTMTIKAGMEINGLPPVIRGQSKTVPMVKANPPINPLSAPAKVKYFNLLGGTYFSTISSTSWSGCGITIFNFLGGTPLSKSSLNFDMNSALFEKVILSVMDFLLKLGNGQNGKCFGEDEEKHKKPSKAAKCDAKLDDARYIKSKIVGIEIVGE